MLDYLQGVLDGRANGISVSMRLRAENAGTFMTNLVAVDQIGIITTRDGTTTAYPWPAVRKIDIKDNAL